MLNTELKMKTEHFIDPFLKIIPNLDVHGETSDSVKVVVNDFIKMNAKLGKPKMAIIHGKGTGTLKRTIKETFSKHPLVERCYLYQFNDGITIIELKDVH